MSLLPSESLALAKALLENPKFLAEYKAGTADLRSALNNPMSVGDQWAKAEVKFRPVDVHADDRTQKKGWKGLKSGTNGRHSGARRGSL